MILLQLEKVSEFLAKDGLMLLDVINPTDVEVTSGFSQKLQGFFEKLPNSAGVSEFFSNVTNIKPDLTDIIDIAIVAFVIYNATKLIRETRAFQLVKGLLLLGVAYLVIHQLGMQTTSIMFRVVFQNIFIILIVLFQQEIRQVIERIGQSRFVGVSWLFKGNNSEQRQVISESIIEISKAVQRMGAGKTGSLIVMEKELLLGDVIKTGTSIDAKVTHELIGNIFFPNSPLHDGAAVIRDGRLVSAGCVLPLTKEDDISSDLGTRHRAAIGMSEQSDAMVIVTSEETGTISLAFRGVLTRNLTEAQLRERLLNYFLNDDSGAEETENNIFKRIFKGIKNGKKESKNK